MTKKRTIAIGLIIVFILVLLYSVKFNRPSATSNNLSEEAIQLFGYINDYRIANGLPALIWDVNCAGVANIRANEICISYTHKRPDGRNFFTTYADIGIKDDFLAGENIVSGTDPNVYNYFLAWKNSPPHNACMLSPNVSKGAIGVALAPNGEHAYVLEVSNRKK